MRSIAVSVRLALLSFLMATVALPSAVSQTRPRPPMNLDPGQARDLQASCSLAWRDGQLRAEGPHYAASFAAGGVEFTPALGARSPRAFPLRLRTVAVGRESELHDLAASDTLPAHEALTARFARGSGIAETWDARPEGIELAYTFASRLPGHGDLVVRLAVDTELEPVAGSDTAGHEDALRLHALSVDGGPLGGVRIGGVTGIDAAGCRQRGSLRLRDGMLELRLPADFVEAAAHPLVLDPLIGADFAINPAHDQTSPGVAYDAVSQRYLVVWQQEIDLNNTQIVGRFVDAQGAPVGSSILIHYSSGSQARHPVVASVRSSGRFLVAWQQAPSVFGPWVIACRCVHADGSQSATLTTALNPGLEYPGPLLGGNASATDTTALMTWVEGASVFAQRITVPAGTAAPSLAGAAITLGTSTFVMPALSMSASNGPSGRWAVCWTRNDFSTQPYSRRVQLISNSGSLVGSELDLGVSSHLPHGLDGDGSRYLLASPTFTGVSGQRLAWNGSTLVADGAATEIVTSPTGKTDLSVTWLGPKVLLAWSDDGGTPLQNDITGIALDPATCRACDLPFTIARAGSYEFAPKVAAQWAASATAGDESLIVFATAPLTPPFGGTVLGQRFAAIGPGGTLASLGGACGRSLTMTPVGRVAIANSGLLFQLDGVAGAIGVFFSIGVPGGPAVPCGTCQVTVPLFLPLVRHGGNRAVLPLPVGCDMSLVGAQLELQGWVLGTVESPCPLVPSMSFSDRQIATIGL